MEERWNGEERRKGDGHKADLSEVWDLLREVDEKITTHLVLEEQTRPKLIELIELLEKSKGVLTFIRWAAYVSAALAAIVAWGKDHIKL